MLDRVMEQHAKQRVHHIGYLLLLRILRMDVSHGDQPFLPHGHLQDGTPILTVVVAEQCHIRQEQLLYLQQLLRLLRLSNQRRYHFEDH